jgi:hypothetical protein
MPLSIFTLGQIFGDIFSSANTSITYANLLEMIDVEDNFNRGCYTYDKTFLTEAAAKSNYENANGNFVLYYLHKKKADDGSGYTEEWCEIKDSNQLISSGAELYLKKTGSNPVEYVSIYDLIKLNTATITDPNARKEGMDSGMAMAAVMYARSCLQRKIMILHLSDMEAVNAEQKLINVIMSLFEKMSNDLRALDGKKKDGHSLPPDSKIVTFMVARELLDATGSTGTVTASFIARAKEKIAAAKIPFGKELDNAPAGIGEDLKLSSSKVAIWQDTLRIYGEQVTNDISLRHTNLQQAMQLSQQDLTMGTNLLASVEKLKGDAIGNIR